MLIATVLSLHIFTSAAMLDSGQPGIGRFSSVSQQQGSGSTGGGQGQPPGTPSQVTDEDAKKIAAAVTTQLASAKIFQIGLSLGWRLVLSNNERLLRDVALGPDGMLLVDRTDGSSVVLSGVVAAYPFTEAVNWTKTLRNLGFLANINLADFTADSVGVFNKSIEGGIGLSLRLHEKFAVAVTLERAFSRKLRDGIDTSKPLLDANGQPLTVIDRADSRYFKEDNVTGISLKWLFTF